MDKKASPNTGVNPQSSVDAPFTTFFELNERSEVPAEYRTAPTFSITRLRSPFGLQDRITKSSSVPALLLSVSLKPLASSSYRVDGRQIDQNLDGTFVSIECGRL